MRFADVERDAHEHFALVGFAAGVKPTTMWLSLEAQHDSAFLYPTYPAPFVCSLGLFGRARSVDDAIMVRFGYHDFVWDRWNEWTDVAPRALLNNANVGLLRTRHVGPVALGIRAFVSVQADIRADALEEGFRGAIELERAGLWDPPAAPAVGVADRPVRFHPDDHEERVRRCAAALGVFG